MIVPSVKDIPVCPATASAAATRVTARRFQIALITPMFGGGVETRTNDRDFPIRPTAIRGQLQFWWRATVGAQCAGPKELRDAQSAIWGSTACASRVHVLVENVVCDDPESCADFSWNSTARGGRGVWRIRWRFPFDVEDSALPYALFPFQGEPPPDRSAKAAEPPSVCIRRASFRLVVRCPADLWGQVEPAIWAWVNFGGMGSRTRRGCGAIRCDDLAPKNHQDLMERLKPFVQTPSDPCDWPTLATTILIGNRQADPILAWNQVIKAFRDFRQGEGVGRNPGNEPNRPGRSRWPEPETLREIRELGANRQRSGHQRLKHIPADAFPRAELGMPIVFHFQGRGNPPPEPRDAVLYPCPGADGKPRGRMASPLILKPLALANGDTIPLMVRLTTRPLAGVDLRCGEKPLSLPPTTVVRDAKLSAYDNSPLAGSCEGSALAAFLAFARTKGFEEVPR